MPYIMPTQRMAFFFSPKAGGTSLRAFLFHAENGFAFRSFTVQGEPVDANALMLNNRFGRVNHEELEDYRRFALVRDPVRRFLSGYSNRVLHYRELSIEAAGQELLRHGLPPDPDLATFVENFAAYMKCSKPLARHFFRQQKFLGPRGRYYDRIFRLEAVDELVDFVNAECGTSARMPHLQTGGAKFDFFDLDEDLQMQIVMLCQHDVAFRMYPGYWTSYAHLLDEADTKPELLRLGQAG